MAKCNIEIGQDVYLFTAMSFHSSTSSHTPLLSRPLSYTRCREMFLDALKQVGIEEPTNYGLHSTRSGEATHLANRGVPQDLIMQHGRWKTTNAKKQICQKRSHPTPQCGKSSFWGLKYCIKEDCICDPDVDVVTYNKNMVKISL